MELLILLVITTLLVFSRLVPHSANYSLATIAVFFALTVMPLWGLGFLFVLGSLLITDFIIGVYPGMEWTYLGYIFIGLTGLFYRSTLKHSGWLFRSLSLVVSLLSGAIVFFILSNLGVWLQSGIYTKNLPGLVECFLMAIPFFKGTLVVHVIGGLGLMSVWQVARLKVFARKASEV
jgi:hypothetical protein